MSQPNELASVEGQLVGMPLAGPESFSAEQLAYLKRALGVDETVLYDSNMPALNNTITLSEGMANFKYVDVSFYNPTTGDNPISYRYPTALFNATRIAFKVTWAVNYMTEAWLKFTPTNDVKVWTYVNNTVIQYRNNATTVTIIQDDTTYIKTTAKLKIVGVHRIAGGN